MKKKTKTTTEENKKEKDWKMTKKKEMRKKKETKGSKSRKWKNTIRSIIAGIHVYSRFFWGGVRWELDEKKKKKAWIMENKKK